MSALTIFILEVTGCCLFVGACCLLAYLCARDFDEDENIWWHLTDTKEDKD